MIRSVFIFKVQLFGPFLPALNSLVRDFKTVPYSMTEYQWVTPMEGLNSSPSLNMNSIKVKTDKTITNGKEIYFEVHYTQPSMRLALHELTTRLNDYCAALACTTIGGRYYYKIIEGTLTNSSGEVVEGLPSDFLKVVAYKTENVSGDQIKYVEDLGNISLSDPVIKSALKYFHDGMDYELMTEITSEATLLSYYKVIETITNEVAKKIKLPKVDIQAQHDSLIVDLQSKLSHSIRPKVRLNYFRDAMSSYRTIEGNITKDKISKVAQFLKISNQSELISVVDARNKVLAHVDHQIKLSASQGIVFREQAKEFIRKYSLTYYSKKFGVNSISNKPYVTKQFANREGYLVAPLFNSEYFKI